MAKIVVGQRYRWFGGEFEIIKISSIGIVYYKYKGVGITFWQEATAAEKIIQLGIKNGDYTKVSLVEEGFSKWLQS